jgi:hypothetical protein
LQHCADTIGAMAERNAYTLTGFVVAGIVIAYLLFIFTLLGLFAT